jgi:hypothetical protein
MNSTAARWVTDISQAKLLSKLSGRPHHVCNDVFVWNDHIVDRASAVVALLKVNNQVPVSDHVKMRMHDSYLARFADYEDRLPELGNNDETPDAAARIWFNTLCRTIKGKNETLPNDQVHRILIDLHSQ